MARIRTGYKYGVTVKEAQAARMLALGEPFDTVAYESYGSPLKDPNDPKEQRRMMSKARRTLRKWLEDPRFQEVYKAIIMEIALPAYGKAVQTLSNQTQSSNEWLANKASNDVLTRFGDMVLGRNSQEVVVRIEGMPTLGTPDSYDDDNDPLLPNGPPIVLNPSTQEGEQA